MREHGSGYLRHRGNGMEGSGLRLGLVSLIDRLVRCVAAASLTLIVSAAGLDAADSRLASAVKDQNKEAAHQLLKENIDVNAAQPDGSTALHWAAHWNDLETAELLIRAGANVNTSTDLGVTPLYLAAEIGSAAMIEKLLKASADPNAAPPLTGISPLMMAARSGTVEGIQFLLAHGAQVNAREKTQEQTALMWAVAQQHTGAVQALLAGGADVRARTKSGSLFIVRGDPAQVPSLASLDTIMTGGSTSLLFAARHGDIRSASLLLEAGADVNDAAADGTSVLVTAAHSGQSDFAKFLLEQGADPNSDAAGYTALHAAVMRNDVDLAKALIAHGASPDARVSKPTPMRRNSADVFIHIALEGATPLVMAARYASADMLRELVAAGANPALKAKDGSTLLTVAMNPNRQGQPGDPPAVPEEDAVEPVKFLLGLDIDVNAVNESGDAAIHVAAGRGFNSLMGLLAEKGADLELKNGRGQTPLALVAGRPQLSRTAELLRKLGAQE